MTTRTDPWPAGVPCWTDLTVPDIAAAERFYGAVLGWTFRASAPEYGGYVTGEVDGRSAGGIGPAIEGVRPAWTLYLASDDADATAAAVTEHGGTLLLAPGDVGVLGRMFVAADPTGAAFGVWQAGQMIGATVVNEPGGIAWEDLRTPDAEAARSFYSAVFGFRSDPVEGAPDDYQTFSLAGEQAPRGGIGGAMGDALPAHWLVYFGVADLEGAVQAATAEGGTVLSPPEQTPFGALARLEDPFGAVFMAVESDGPSPASQG